MYTNKGKRDILIFNLSLSPFRVFLCQMILILFQKELESSLYKFETIVDEISVELIGKHEESIIIKNLKLRNNF